MKISQVDARKLKRRVQELERILEHQRAAWCCDYPGGTHIATVEMPDASHTPTAVRVARKLGHSVVVIDSDRQLLLYAMPHPDTPA